MLLELTSSPMVYPTISAWAFTTIASSGSGTSHVESDRTTTVPSGPTTRRGVAFRKISGRSARYTLEYTSGVPLSSIRASSERWYVTPAAHTSIRPSTGASSVVSDSGGELAV